MDGIAAAIGMGGDQLGRRRGVPGPEAGPGSAEARVFGLVLDTSGIRHQAAWSPRPAEIFRPVQEIATAIGHTDVARTAIDLLHVEHGSLIEQYAGPPRIWTTARPAQARKRGA
ncbi:hypothetical protein [Streptomyces sp. NPDC060198]|uniref:hypothetical protein n=1 Tax=Streptomyces sp. NPDC060198 TaxID=3347070 RepID=UPI0036503364